MSPSEESGRPRTAEPLLLELLARASHALVRGFTEELRAHGISVPVWRVMAALSDRPDATVSTLAEACLMQQPTMTKLLDRLSRDGLVARSQDPRDRRVVRVVLTPVGKAKAGELAAAAERYEAEVLARHPGAEGIKAALADIIAASGSARRAGSGDGA